MAPTVELQQWLRNAKLARHADKLMDQNVVGLTCLDDMKDMSDSDVHDVATAVNMNLMETKRFERAVQGLAGATAQNGTIGKTSFTVGEQVEYYSENLRSWYDCTITAIRPTGEVEVSCKPGTWITVAQQVTRLRASGRPQVMCGAGQVHFHVGDKVQYYSETMKRWYDCTVTAMRPSGEVGLSCKPGAWIPVSKQAANLRAGGGGCGSSGGQMQKAMAGHALAHAAMTMGISTTRHNQTKPPSSKATRSKMTQTQAAVKMQSAFRGKLARQKLAARPGMTHRSRGMMGGGMRPGMVPITHHHAPLAAMTHHRHTTTHHVSPLENAAVRIQAAFRGQQARRGMMAGGHGGIGGMLGPAVQIAAMHGHGHGGIGGMLGPAMHGHGHAHGGMGGILGPAMHGHGHAHGGMGGMLGPAMNGLGHGHAHGGIGGLLGRLL